MVELEKLEEALLFFKGSRSSITVPLRLVSERMYRPPS
jgi:hypothetical protein